MASTAAPHTGTTIVACTFDGGVVLGADGRVSTGRYISNRASNKIANLTDNTFLLRSGSAADCQAISDYGAHSCCIAPGCLFVYARIGASQCIYRSPSMPFKLCKSLMRQFSLKGGHDVQVQRLCAKRWSRFRSTACTNDRSVRVACQYIVVYVTFTGCFWNLQCHILLLRWSQS